MRRWLLAVLMAVALAAVGCGGSSEGGHADHQAGAGSEQGSVPGSPADASEADRTVEVQAFDQLRFDPASIEVSAGEVVTFVVTNEGQSDHEFVLGDSDYQEGHADDADHDMSMGNAVSVAPGETEELTWEFDESGEVLYGCHVSGHYDGGMVGTIEIS